MKEKKTLHFSKEDICAALSLKFAKHFTVEQMSMSSKGAMVNFEVESGTSN